MSLTAPKRRQLNLAVTEKVYAGLAKDAAARGVPVSTSALSLFEAAWAARHGETGDRDLDATVSAVLLLSAKLDTEATARALKCSEVLVRRIRRAWEKHQGASS